MNKPTFVELQDAISEMNRTRLRYRAAADKAAFDTDEISRALLRGEITTFRELKRRQHAATATYSEWRDRLEAAAGRVKELLEVVRKGDKERTSK